MIAQSKLCSVLLAAASVLALSGFDSNAVAQVADVHFHPSNYAFQGVSLNQLLRSYMDQAHVQRSVVMPLPVQQRWDSFEGYQVRDLEKGRYVGPTYYIGPKADAYYYAFADAMYAKEFLSLPREDQDRLDLMITGFNPMDRYAVQQIKRALLTYPGAFAGIGEFSVHKELVSDKIAGEPIARTTNSGLPPDVTDDDKTSLYAQSLRDILNFASESGLVVNLHNDIYPVTVSHDGTLLESHSDRPYDQALIDLCKDAPDARVIWAHTGLGRFVKPQQNHLVVVRHVLDSCPNWYVDLSWDVVQKWMDNPEPGMPTIDEWRQFIADYRYRTLWGSDTVIYSRNVFTFPNSVHPGQRITLQKYQTAVHLLDPLFDQMQPDYKDLVLYRNYVELFNDARSKVRAWEAAHANDDVWDLAGPPASSDLERWRKCPARC